MADNWTRNVICRYYKNGMCREGESCRYRHLQGAREDGASSQEAAVPPPATSVCRFFGQGTCKFGSRCRFVHTPGENSGADTASSPKSNASGGSGTPAMDKIKDVPAVAEEWVNAPEFVPSFISSTACSSSSSSSSSSRSSSSSSTSSSPAAVAATAAAEVSGISGTTSIGLSYARVVNPAGRSSNSASEPICPYAEASGICKKPDCTYIHGDICELCGRAALHPLDEEQRKKHTNACVKQHEVDMELSFAIQRSREKSCGVCFETIMEKSSRERRFGILPNCNHCFCLTCIRKWRQAKQFENKIIRACPECRVTSDFVCPSMYWVDTKEEKEKLITDYKDALSAKDCKYFNKGRGKCPFGNKCFYLHALPDGTKTDVGPPVRHRRNVDADLDFLYQLILWDFFDERDNRWMYNVDEFDDIVTFFSDSEDSDFSD